MRKIIAAFDGLRYSESTTDYALFLAQQAQADLAGVFLTESTRLSYSIYETLVEQSIPGKATVDAITKSDSEVMNESVKAFERSCQAAKISYLVHRDPKNAIKELLHETLFADLLTLDRGETFSYLEGSEPAGFIRQVLHDSKCPVVVVPHKFVPIKKVALLYDGSPSSIFAMKMFNYVLPSMSSLETKLLCAKDALSAQHLPDNKLIKEWMKRHFPNATTKVLRGEEKELVTALTSEGPGLLIVAGVYHRSTVSMWLHKSLADSLINEIDAPVFAAHS
jgi:hypothetical protein